MSAALRSSASSMCPRRACARVEHVHVRAVRRWTATTASSFGDQREAQHARVYAYVRSSPVGTARRLTASCPRVRLDQNPAPVVELPTRVDVLSGMKISTPPLLKMRSVRLRGWTLGQVLPAVQDWPERCLLAPFQHNRPVFEGRKNVIRTMSDRIAARGAFSNAEIATTTSGHLSSSEARTSSRLRPASGTSTLGPPNVRRTSLWCAETILPNAHEGDGCKLRE